MLVALGTPGSVISYRGLIAKDLIFTWVTFLSQPLRFMPPTHPRSYAKSLQVKDQSVTLSAPLPLMFVDWPSSWVNIWWPNRRRQPTPWPPPPPPTRKDGQFPLMLFNFYLVDFLNNFIKKRKKKKAEKIDINILILLRELVIHWLLTKVQSNALSNRRLISYKVIIKWNEKIHRKRAPPPPLDFVIIQILKNLIEGP